MCVCSIFIALDSSYKQCWKIINCQQKRRLQTSTLQGCIQHIVYFSYRFSVFLTSVIWCILHKDEGGGGAKILPWMTAWSSVQNCTQESTVVYLRGMPHLLTYMAKRLSLKCFSKSDNSRALLLVTKYGFSISNQQDTKYGKLNMVKGLKLSLLFNATHYIRICAD